MTAKPIHKFNARLDELLGLTPGSSRVDHPKIDQMLEVAETLNKIDFDSELSPRAGIDARWRGQFQRFKLAQPLSIARLLWVPLVIVLVALLAVFHQPVFAAVSRAFGYIFVQDVGFVPADSTFLLKQPILQEHNGQSVTVGQGVATPQNIILFLEFNDVARPVDGAGMETVSGETIKLLQWEYFPNTPGSHGIKMIFSSLPVGTTKTILSLPEGWHLPLEWLSASHSNLPDARVVPYISATQESTASSDMCVEKHGMNLCVLAATTSPDGTSVLVETHATNPNLHSSWMGPVWQEGVVLQDEQGNRVSMQRHEAEMLIFPPLSSETQKVTLVVPSIPADVVLSNQNIFVDLGTDPQPDTVIPLDANIQVLGTIVHFSKATFVGDGVNSLRLTLNADEPIPTADGIKPISFDLGKPDRVDDLYGSGMLEGSKDIFIELIRPNGKITGVLTIPIIRATVLVEGPFEFSFPLTESSSLTPTPVEANPNTFSPASTPTSLPMDDYSYTGEELKGGDLLFTVFNGTNSEVYAFTPDLDSKPRLVITLPGAVGQIYVHPDYQGIDYLAGLQTSKDEVSYIKDLSLYTVLFHENAPRLLYTFPPTPENFVGPTVHGSWTYDGRYAIFNYVKPTPGNDFEKSLWLDMACRSSENCVAHEIVSNQNLDTYNGTFAPSDYRFLITGADISGTGEMDLFMMNFDPNSSTQQVVNITANSSSFPDDVTAPAVWAPDGRIFTLCNDGQLTTRFCYVDPSTGQITSGPVFTEHIFQYEVSATGQSVLGIVINHDAPGKGFLEIHRYDLNAQAGPTLGTGAQVPFAAISPSDEFIAYTTENNDQVQLIKTLTGKTVPLTSSATPNSITWLAWVR